MNVVAVIPSFDIGGQGVRLKQAFERYGGEWAVRSIVKDISYRAYPTDLPLIRRGLDELYQACGVFHARLDFEEYDRLAAKYGPKPVILHHHGSRLRRDPNRFIREQRARNAIGLVSTLDLYLLGPDDFVWLPAPYDIDALMELRHAQRPELQPRR